MTATPHLDAARRELAAIDLAKEVVAASNGYGDKTVSVRERALMGLAVQAVTRPNLLHRRLGREPEPAAEPIEPGSATGWLDDLTRDMPGSWSDAETVEEMVSAYLHELERRIVSMGGNLDRWSEISDAVDRRPGSSVTPRGDDRETWLQARLHGGVGQKSLEAATKILGTRGLDDPLRQVLVEALHGLVDEIERWKDSWAAAYVDADRKVREASRKAHSCEHHGEQIAELERLTWRLGDERERMDAARVVWVEFGYRTRKLLETVADMPPQDQPDVRRILEAVSRDLERASKAQDRRFHR